MAALEELFANPKIALGYGLLASRENPISAAFGLLQQGQELRQNQEANAIRNKLIERQMRGLDIEEKAATQQAEMNQRIMQELEATGGGGLKTIGALYDRPTLYQYGKDLEEQQANEAAAQRLRGNAPSGGEMPQGGGYLASGLDMDLSGIGGGEVPTQETLPPITGMDAAPLDPQAKLQKLLKEYEDLARDPDSGTTAFQNAMKAKKEEIDIAKSQIPSPQDALKLQEAEEKRAGGKQVAMEALYYANKLLSNEEGLNRATGQIGGYIPNVLSESAANAEADLEALRSALTTDKLSLMTGVLTDKDIEMLKNIAAGGIGSTRGDARVVEEVARVRDTLQKNLLGQGKGKVNPNSAAGLRAEAQSAIAKGASPESVAARFKQLTGEDL